MHGHSEFRSTLDTLYLLMDTANSTLHWTVTQHCLEGAGSTYVFNRMAFIAWQQRSRSPIIAYQEAALSAAQYTLSILVSCMDGLSLKQIEVGHSKNIGLLVVKASRHANTLTPGITVARAMGRIASTPKSPHSPITGYGLESNH